MSGNSRAILEATRLLCASRGALQLPKLHERLRERCNITADDLCTMVREHPRFVLVRGPERDGRLRPEECTVVAQTSLRLCRSYGRGEPCGGCEELHLCKFFIYGTCRFGKGRKPCRFSHDVRSDHNYRLLRECSLHELDEDELFLLLLQNDPALLPEVCLPCSDSDRVNGVCFFVFAGERWSRVASVLTGVDVNEELFVKEIRIRRSFIVIVQQ